MKNKFLAIGVLIAGGAFLLSCAPASMQTKPEPTAAATAMAPTPAPSLEPTPTEVPAPLPTPAAAPHKTSRGRSHIQKSGGTGHTSSGAAENQTGSAPGNEQAGGPGSALLSSRAEEKSPETFWTPTPIAQTENIPQPAVQSHAGGWLLAGLVVLLALLAAVITYRRMNPAGGKGAATESLRPPSDLPHQVSTAAKREPEIAEKAETAAAKQPVAPEVQEPAPEVKPRAASRVRKVTRKPRTQAAGTRLPAKRTIKAIKSEVRKKAA